MRLPFHHLLNVSYQLSNRSPETKLCQSLAETRPAWSHHNGANILDKPALVFTQLCVALFTSSRSFTHVRPDRAVLRLSRWHSIGRGRP